MKYVLLFNICRSPLITAWQSNKQIALSVDVSILYTSLRHDYIANEIVHNYREKLPVSATLIESTI